IHVSLNITDLETNTEQIMRRRLQHAAAKGAGHVSNAVKKQISQSEGRKLQTLQNAWNAGNLGTTKEAKEAATQTNSARRELGSWRADNSGRWRWGQSNNAVFGSSIVLQDLWSWNRLVQSRPIRRNRTNRLSLSDLTVPGRLGNRPEEPSFRGLYLDREGYWAVP
ncbi:unnamed protein product, partial [Nezara viridula]